MKQVPIVLQMRTAWRRMVLICLLVGFTLGVIVQSERASLYAQEQDPAQPVQLVSGRLEPGAGQEVYLLDGLQAGDTLYATLHATSGNLDPFLAVLDARIDFAASEAEFQAEMQELLVTGGDVSLAVEELYDRSFLSWDDDGGDGYAAALEFPITTSGDYYLVASSALSATATTLPSRICSPPFSRIWPDSPHRTTRPLRMRYSFMPAF